MATSAVLIPAERLVAARRRKRTESVKRLSKRALARDAADYPAAINAAHPRPATRAACEARGLGTATPCPYVSCRWHLYLDVNGRTGSITVNFPDRDPDELDETCALAVADRGGATLEGVGEVMNLTRERVRQLETRSSNVLAAALGVLGRELLGLPVDPDATGGAR